MATTLEFGTCSQCRNSNSKVLEKCRHCGALLPWAKAKTAPRADRPGTITVVSRPSLNIDWGAWGIAALSFAVPIIGYFLYRSYSENGSERAGPALIGAILGVLFHVARVIYRTTSPFAGPGF